MKKLFFLLLIFINYNVFGEDKKEMTYNNRNYNKTEYIKEIFDELVNKNTTQEEKNKIYSVSGVLFDRYIQKINPSYSEHNFSITKTERNYMFFMGKTICKQSEVLMKANVQIYIGLPALTNLQDIIGIIERIESRNTLEDWRDRYK